MYVEYELSENGESSLASLLVGCLHNPLQEWSLSLQRFMF